MVSRNVSADIHRFWFDDALAEPDKAEQRNDFWFRSDAATDRLIAERYAHVLEAAARGELVDWEEAPRSALALIIVLDQFPRNIHRATPAAFAHDAEALGVTKRGLAAGHLHKLHMVEQGFFRMPFQHSEDLATQREGMALFQRMADEAPPEWRALAENYATFARMHLELVERFGRFPHRNAILGRESSAAEREFLETNTESFGQTAR